MYCMQIVKFPSNWRINLKFTWNIPILPEAFLSFTSKSSDCPSHTSGKQHALDILTVQAYAFFFLLLVTVTEVVRHSEERDEENQTKLKRPKINYLPIQCLKVTQMAQFGPTNVPNFEFGRLVQETYHSDSWKITWTELTYWKHVTTFTWWNITTISLNSLKWQ